MDEEEMILPSAGELFFFWERKSIPSRWILISITYIVYAASLARDDPNPEISYGAFMLFIILFSLTLGPIIDVFLALTILYLRFLGFVLLILTAGESPPTERVSSNTYGGSHSRGCSCYYCNGQYSADSSGD